MKKSSIASPDGALAFLFAIFSMLIWYVTVSIDLSNATLLSLGLMWLLLCLGALIAALINIIRGTGGNTNLLGVILLGLIPGVDTLAAFFFRSIGVTYQPQVYGCLYLIGAIFVFGAALRRKRRRPLVYLRTLAIAAGFLFLGLGDLLGAHGIRAAGGWLMLLYAFISFYYGQVRLYEEFGWPHPEEDDVASAGRRGKISSPQVILSFICASFGIISFVLAFFDVPDDSILAAGIIRLVLGGIYFISALINLYKGSPLGNLNLIFAVCFGLFAGSTLLMEAMQDLLGFAIQPMIYSILQMSAGLYLLTLIPALSWNPLFRQVALVCSGSGLVCSALNAFTGWQGFLYASGLFFLVFCLLNIYSGLNALLPQALPEGPSLAGLVRHRKEQKR